MRMGRSTKERRMVEGSEKRRDRKGGRGGREGRGEAGGSILGLLAAGEATEEAGAGMTRFR